MSAQQAKMQAVQPIEMRIYQMLREAKNPDAMARAIKFVFHPMGMETPHQAFINACVDHELVAMNGSQFVPLISHEEQERVFAALARRR